MSSQASRRHAVGHARQRRADQLARVSGSRRTTSTSTRNQPPHARTRASRAQHAAAICGVWVSRSSTQIPGRISNQTRSPTFVGAHPQAPRHVAAVVHDPRLHHAGPQPMTGDRAPRVTDYEPPRRCQAVRHPSSPPGPRSAPPRPASVASATASPRRPPPTPSAPSGAATAPPTSRTQDRPLGADEHLDRPGPIGPPAERRPARRPTLGHDSIPLSGVVLERERGRSTRQDHSGPAPADLLAATCGRLPGGIRRPCLVPAGLSPPGCNGVREPRSLRTLSWLRRQALDTRPSSVRLHGLLGVLRHQTLVRRPPLGGRRTLHPVRRPGRPRAPHDWSRHHWGYATFAAGCAGRTSLAR